MGNISTDSMLFLMGPVEADAAQLKKSTLLKTAGLDLDIEIGDVILTGRFKNKRTIVKKLGTDELGQPTVNGMKLLAMRLEKEMPTDRQSKATINELEKQADVFDKFYKVYDSFDNDNPFKPGVNGTQKINFKKNFDEYLPELKHRNEGTVDLKKPRPKLERTKNVTTKIEGKLG